MTQSRIAGVSRETFEQLEDYAVLIQKWNPTINLVGKSTIQDLWHRHIEDSLESVHLAQNTKGPWLDMGSGGGFPGIVAAIVVQSQRKTILIESDQRKSTFLRTVIRQLNLNATVVSKRIEDVTNQKATTVTARALAPLVRLLELSLQHISPNAEMIFPKGQKWEQEVLQARQSFAFELESHPSMTQEGSVNLHIKDLQRYDET